MKAPHRQPPKMETDQPQEAGTSHLGNPNEFQLRDHTEHILEQYKLHAQLAEAHVARGQTYNRFFLTLQAALISGFLVVSQENFALTKVQIVVIVLAACVFCLIWWLILQSSRKMTSFRYEILEEIEQFLPIRPFCAEWYDKIQQGSNYTHINKLSQLIPLIFALIFILLGVTSILSA